MILSPDQRERLILLDRAHGAQELLRGLAHEIRNNLQVVALASQLGDANRTPEIDVRVEQAIEDINRTLELLGTLGRNPAEGPSTVALGELLSSIKRLSELQRGVPSRRVEWVAPAEAKTLAVPPGIAIQIVLNLVTNAKEAAVNLVRVECGVVDGMAMVTVDDDGTGPPLDPGAPLVSSRHTADHGGLGLFAAMSLARRCGGSVRITLRPEGGTRATVILPIART